MPWKSVQQARWGHTPEGEKALGGPEKVAEWDRATHGTKLPRRAPKQDFKSRVKRTFKK